MELDITTPKGKWQIPDRLTKVTSLSRCFALLLLVSLPFVGGFVGYNYAPVKVVEVEKVSVSTPEKSNQSVAGTEIIDSPADSHVLIYKEKVGSVDDNSRSWPIYNIWRKVGLNDPELLATIGKVGEFPSEFTLSPDRRLLSIDLESKIQILNLETRELETIFVPTQETGGAGAFSPDSKKIAVVDGSYYTDIPDSDGVRHAKSMLYSIDLSSKEASLLHQEDSLLYDNAVAWREDGTIVTSMPMAKGCASPRFYYYDPSDANIHDLPRSITWYAGDYVSGWEIAALANPSPYAPEHEVLGMCDSGKGIDFYTIVDPITGDVFGDIGKSGAYVDIRAISPDKTQVLFRVTNQDIRGFEPEHYIQSPGGTAELTENSVKILSSWGIQAFPYKSLKDNFIVGEYDEVYSENELSIIAQY